MAAFCRLSRCQLSAAAALSVHFCPSPFLQDVLSDMQQVGEALGLAEAAKLKVRGQPGSGAGCDRELWGGRGGGSVAGWGPVAFLHGCLCALGC